VTVNEINTWHDDLCNPSLGPLIFFAKFLIDPFVILFSASSATVSDLAACNKFIDWGAFHYSD
jgi:hypothetical protein